MSPRDDPPDSGDEAALEVHEEQPAAMKESSRKRRHKKIKMAVGEDSGLTEEERRVLRREQRELAKQLHEGPVDEDAQFVEKARKKNNELFEKVRYTREAVLDAENVDAIAAKLSKKVDDMVQVPRYDANRLIQKLKRKVTGRSAGGEAYFDWKVLGTEAGVCFNSVPSRVTFLVGPLSNVQLLEKRKARVVRQKQSKNDEELEEQKPEELAKEKQKKTADQLSQAERNLKKMTALLHKRCEETKAENRAKYEKVKETEPGKETVARRELIEHGDEIDFVQFLVNPKSFTQTVENIFNFSFLIKKGEAKIKMRKPTPMGDSNVENCLNLPLAGCFVAEGEKEFDSAPRQCIIPFTMKDWRSLIEAYDLKECDIPHRKGTKQQKAASQTRMSQEDDDE